MSEIQEEKKVLLRIKSFKERSIKICRYKSHICYLSEIKEYVTIEVTEKQV